MLRRAIMDESGHIPVLADAALATLGPKAGQTYLDCTAGRGGHAAMIAARLAPGGRVVALDADPVNVDFVRRRLAGAPVAVDVRHANFMTARAVLDELGVGGVDLMLADLGFASSQMSDPHRGLSFAADGPLDMRLDPTLATTAADLLAQLPERELADLIYRYGQERHSRRIARKIVAARGREPMTTTRRLAEVVRSAYPPQARGRSRGSGGSRIDPATRTFMALRIAVNGEIEALEQLLVQLPRLLNPGGTAAVISFHSLEDRLVKQSFRELAQAGRAELLTRRPLTADEQEIAANPRSRSARLRAIRWRG